MTARPKPYTKPADARSFATVRFCDNLDDPANLLAWREVKNCEVGHSKTRDNGIINHKTPALDASLHAAPGIANPRQTRHSGTIGFNSTGFN